MDAWGYSFRVGSTRAWFEGDAADARQWLRDHGVIDAGDRPTGAVRPAPRRRQCRALPGCSRPPR
ncbi:MAG: hypothetical protein E6K30_00095, partial [Gammaproteobacteria bacterium]